MEFINESEKKVMIRIDAKTNSGYDWVYLKPQEKIDIEEEYGYRLGLSPVNGKKEKSKEKKEDEIIIRKKKDKDGKLSKTDIKDLNKDQQVDLLKKFGLKPSEIKKLRTENSRVNRILKLQDGKNN